MGKRHLSRFEEAAPKSFELTPPTQNSPLLQPTDFEQSDTFCANSRCNSRCSSASCPPFNSTGIAKAQLPSRGQSTTASYIELMITRSSKIAQGAAWAAAKKWTVQHLIDQGVTFGIQVKQMPKGWNKAPKPTPSRRIRSRRHQEQENLDSSNGTDWDDKARIAHSKVRTHPLELFEQTANVARRESRYSAASTF